jgi:regulator of protease activity HflC (stomatin/prohibitin superfamily)
MRTMRHAFLAAAVAACGLGCASQDIPQAYKGRMFDRTGPLALYIGGNGLSGPVLGPGVYYTGVYNEVRLVDCSMITKREPLTALTKDGVQFGLDIYVRLAADCSDRSVTLLLQTLTPDQGGIAISSARIYDTFVRPAIGEAVREVVSPYRANEINDKREEILASIQKRFVEIMTAREKQIVVYEVNLSNLDFPDAMDTANTDRAVQAILRDKAIAERERVQAESDTMALRKQLSEREGEMEAARIQRVGEALKLYPDFLQFDLQQKMPDIYKTAGENGNLVIAAPSPSIVLTPRPAQARPQQPAQPPPPRREDRAGTP